MRWIAMVLLLAAPLSAGTVQTRTTETETTTDPIVKRSSSGVIRPRPGESGSKIDPNSLISRGGAIRPGPPSDKRTIDPDTLRFEGSFFTPAKSDSGHFGYSLNSMSFAADCMGRKDPSPDDGYPGCLLMTSDKNKLVGLVDIPAPGETAQLVIDHWDLIGDMPERKSYLLRNWLLQGIFYDLREDGTCQIWWHAMSQYGGYTQANWPTLGISSCDPKNPAPTGMWHVGPTTDDPYNAVYHSNKIMGSMRLAPKEFADRHLKGMRLVSGWSKTAGTRGGSPGPSLFYLSENPPRAASESDLRAGQMLWYRWQGSWDWSPKDFPNYRPVNNWSSWEWLEDSQGNQAVVFFWTEAVPTPERYPYSDQPVWWYGRNRCNGRGDQHEPTFPEAYPDGNRPPPDCNLEDLCEHSQGWHALKREFQILFYDPYELGEVARGRREPWSVLPYARIKAPEWFQPPCRYGGPLDQLGSDPEGSAFDKENQLLYFAQSGKAPVVHVLRVQ